MPAYSIRFRADHTGRPPAVQVEAHRVFFPAEAGFVLFENEQHELLAAYNTHAVAGITLLESPAPADPAPDAAAADYGTADREVVGEVRQFGRAEPVRTLTRPVPGPPHTHRDAR